MTMRVLTNVTALCCVTLWITPSFAQPCGVNLLMNPGFEHNAQGWHIDEAEISAVARSGTRSLYYANQATSRYHTFSQQLAVTPGQVIDFGAWIKGRDLQGDDDDQGASAYVQSFDAQGRFLEGSYPQGISGSSGWQPVHASYTVPPHAASVTFGVYLRKGTTGSAWFDDAYACLRQPRPMLYQLGKTHLHRFDSLVAVPLPQRLWFESTLFNVQGGVIQATRDEYQVEKQRRITYNIPADLTPGEYRLRQSVSDSQAQLASSEAVFHISQAAPKVAIDHEGFTQRAGQRFFPLGIYANVPTDEHLGRIAAAGFNTVLNYDYGEKKDPYTFFRNARKHHLQIIYSVKDHYAGTRFAPKIRGDYASLTAWYVRHLREQPNLLAWYINDELGPEYLGEIEKKNLAIKQLDANHPTFQVLNKTGDLDRYFNSSDILATDPYPVGNDPDLTRTTRYTELTVHAARQAKGAWVVMQIMDHAAYEPNRRPHPPSEMEIRNQAWQALIGGAKGLLFYSYTDLFYKRKMGSFNPQEFDDVWAGVANVAQQIAAFTPYLLAGDSIKLTPDGATVPARMFILGDRALLLAVNPYYRAATTQLQLPDGWVQSDGGNQVSLSLPEVGTAMLWLQR